MGPPDGYRQGARPAPAARRGTQELEGRPIQRAPDRLRPPHRAASPGHQVRQHPVRVDPPQGLDRPRSPAGGGHDGQGLQRAGEPGGPLPAPGSAAPPSRRPGIGPLQASPVALRGQAPLPLATLRGADGVLHRIREAAADAPARSPSPGARPRRAPPPPAPARPPPGPAGSALALPHALPPRPSPHALPAAVLRRVGAPSRPLRLSRPRRPLAWRSQISSKSPLPRRTGRPRTAPGQEGDDQLGPRPRGPPPA